MKPFVFSFTLLFLFSNLWGFYTEDEIRRMWTETGMNFRAISRPLSSKQCYRSRKRFGACLIAVNELLSQIKRDGNDDLCYQLRVSNAGELGIVPFAKKDLPQSKEGVFVFREGLRESYWSFYERNTSADSGSQTPLYIQQHDDLVQRVFELAKQVPEKDQSYLAGETYNLLLREVSTHHDSLLPTALSNDPGFEARFYSLGVLGQFYETEDGDNGFVIQPVKIHRLNPPVSGKGI